MLCVALGPSTLTLILVIGIIFTPLIARTVRAAVLAERDLDYLPAARLLGEGPAWIMAREILPNVLPAVLVEFTVRLGYAIFTVATLSFLGFGIQPPTPDWGADIYANYAVLAHETARTLFPFEDPIEKGLSVKLGADYYTVIGITKERASSAGTGLRLP